MLKIAAKKEKGNCYPDLTIPSTSVGKREGWEEWVEDGADTEGPIKNHETSVTERSRRQSTWTGEQEHDSSKAEEGSMPTGDTDDSSSARLENEKEDVEEGPTVNQPEGCVVYRMLQTPISPDFFAFLDQTSVR